MGGGQSSTPYWESNKTHHLEGGKVDICFSSDNSMMEYYVHTVNHTIMIVFNYIPGSKVSYQCDNATRTVNVYIGWPTKQSSQSNYPGVHNMTKIPIDKSKYDRYVIVRK